MIILLIMVILLISVVFKGSVFAVSFLLYWQKNTLHWIFYMYIQNICILHNYTYKVKQCTIFIEKNIY